MLSEGQCTSTRWSLSIARGDTKNVCGVRAWNHLNFELGASWRIHEVRKRKGPVEFEWVAKADIAGASLNSPRGSKEQWPRRN